MVVPGRPRTVAKWIGCGVGVHRICRGGCTSRRPSVRSRDRHRLGGRARCQRASASSRRTRCSRSPTAAGRRRTSTSAGRGARRSGGRAGPARARVLDMKPVGLAGSGGSTPLRLRVAGDPDTYLFGKLYAMSHVRADRWYKLGRTILYGRLEDEAPFQSVRRLVQYEDYTLRLLRRPRDPDGRAVRDRRAHARARVPARHGVLRRREGDRRGRRRRRRHRRGPRA